MFTDPLLWVLLFTVALTPFVLILAARRDRATKRSLRFVFVALLLIPLLVGFLNWESFSTPGRTGFELATSYPDSLLWLFFILVLVEIFFAIIAVPATDVIALSLNAINTILLFGSLISMSNAQGQQLASFASVGSVFALLINNVVGLALVNRDPHILSKYPFFRSKRK